MNEFVTVSESKTATAHEIFNNIYQLRKKGDTSMVLGEQIVKLRKRVNLTQEQLAEKYDVSRQAVAKWENGESIPDIYKIIQIAELFNVSLDFLILGKNVQRQRNEKDVKTFIETMKKKEDMWTPDQVISMYGNMSLEEALKDRNAHMNTMLEELHKNLHGDTMLTGLNIH